VAEQIYDDLSKSNIRQCVTRRPPAFPAGHYWYRGRHHGSGHPPKWINRFVNGKNENGLQSTSEESASDCVSADQNEVDGFIRG